MLLLVACSAAPETAASPVSTNSPTQTTVSPTQAIASSTDAQPAAGPTSTTAVLDCSPTPTDMLGPFYVSGAPVRYKVGEGYLLSGVVRSAADCSPIPDAQIEVWMAGPDGEYADEYRATLYSDDNGSYSFESHFPPPYSGRPSHHHLQVDAPGYQTLVTQHYPQQGENQATFDLVLLPAQ
ncbi:MAG: intradiol ring-cleavage dioxygenase [Anaerolineales bacterium]